MNATPNTQYILGLDLGVQSVGWAVIDLNEDGQPCGIRRAGVRCFDSGVGSETQISMGKDESANAGRRQARLQRRQLWRRGRRLKKVFHCLQKAGLLPADEARTPQQRHELLYKLDAELARTYVPEHDRIAGHLLPYRLRTLALSERLPPFAFGRALFHLAQRRGFLSNRKTISKNGDDDLGAVKAGISELQARIEFARSADPGRVPFELGPRRAAHPQTLDGSPDVSRRIRADMGGEVRAPCRHGERVERTRLQRDISSAALESAGFARWNVRAGVAIANALRGPLSRRSDSATCKKSTTWKSPRPMGNYGDWMPTDCWTVPGLANCEQG